MGIITVPNALTDGTVAKGSEVRGNDDAIAGEFNGRIDDTNIKVGAGINGNKLSNIAGARVPGDRIEDAAIDNLKLKSSASVDGQRAVTTDHIRDAAITAAKLGALAVIAGKVKVATFDFAVVGAAPGATNSISTGLLATNIVPLHVAVVQAANPVSTTAKLSIGLHLNTSTGLYWLTYFLDSLGGDPSVSGVTCRLYYIPLA